MKANRLLEHYERIADAPDAIARLRRFILDLAVRGKLVPQDPKDEPASELLKRIAKEKARLVKAGDARKSDVDPVDLNDAPFIAPRNWAWTTIGAVAKVVMGQSPPGDTYNTTGDGVLLINGPVEFSAEPFGKTVVSLLICVRGSTTGRTNVAGFRACIGRGVAAIERIKTQSVLPSVGNRRHAELSCGSGFGYTPASHSRLVWPKLQL
jgi:type I restriction enzyme, S subunit